jgi:hypothetical protein
MRKSILVLAILAVLALLMVSVVSAQKDDAEEGSFILPALEEGVPFANEFENTAGAQIYAFNGTEGDEVTITMVQETGSGLDPLVVLLGEAGQVYAYNDDADGLSSAIEDFELPASGTYYVLATTFTGLSFFSTEPEEDGPYEYELTVSGFETPEDMEFDQFQFFGLTAEIGDSGELEIMEETPLFFITFPGTEGQVINVVTELGTCSDTLLYLFDQNGNRIAFNDDELDNDGNILDLAARLEEVELPADGLYMIWATSFGFEDAPESGLANEGTFTLAIEDAG